MLEKNEVPAYKIDVLVKKYINNELWDCFKEEYKDLEPQIKSIDFQKTVYPDGSFRILKVEKTDNL